MTPAFIGRDGRSLSSRVALLAALAGANAAEDTTLVRIAIVGEPTLFDGSTIHGRLRVVETAVLTGELSVTIDTLLTRELLDRKAVVLDLPGAALTDPGLAGRLDVVRIVPVGPCAADLLMTDAMPGYGSSLPAGSRLGLRFLSCGLQTGVPDDEMGRLGNAGRTAERVGGRWLVTGLPEFPPREWDAVFRGKPHAGVLALGQALLDELRGTPSTARPAAMEGHAEILGPRLWSLAMEVDAYERGFRPDPADLARAPLLDDWSKILRAVPALTGRFEGHPYIRSGRRSVTSEVFHTDGETYARTLSRLYRLGSPAAPRLH